jgi:signal transduction histidine kinase/ABC-type amino acid transport substrate-binding protein
MILRSALAALGASLHRAALLLCACFFVHATALTYAAGPASRAAGPIAVGSELDYPPYAIVKPDGAPDGFSVELLKTVAGEMHLDLAFEVGPWNEVLNRFRAGRLDVLPLFAMNPERARYADATVPYLTVYGAVFVRSGERRIQSFDDLPGKSVIVMKGDFGHEYALARGLGGRLVATASLAEGMKLLSSGHHDALLVSRLGGLQVLKQLGIGNVVPVGPPIQDYQLKFSFAVRKGDAELLAILNEGLALVKANGAYDEIREKWLGILEPRPLGLKDFLPYLVPAAAILALLLAGLLAQRWLLIHRRRTEKHLLRSREGLRRLAEVSVRVVRQHDREGMMNALAEAALALTGSRIAVCGHSSVEGLFVAGGEARMAGAPPCPAQLSAVMNHGGLYSELLQGADAIRLTATELRAHALRKGLPEAHVPLRGLLGVRLLGKAGNTSGVLLVTDKAQGDFTAEDESLLVQLATLASLAMQHLEARISLEDADRQKNHFLAMLSHELRNPLAPIRNSLYILDHASAGSDQSKTAQQVIDRQVTHMTRLVDDLLDITRLSRGKIQLQRKPIDLRKVVESTAEDHRSSLVRNGIDLRLHIAPAPLWIEADETRVAQVIGNLLHNSAKFTPSGGEVLVAVEPDAGANRAIVRVRDAGIGIAPEMLPSVFEAFAQGDTTLDRKQGGLGLGLALVKGLVEMHGGSVSAASEGLGKGAEFTVRFPLNSPTETDAAAAARQAAAFITGTSRDEGASERWTIS